jgi:hypothetical protein
MKIEENIGELYNLIDEYLFLRETIIKECIRNELIENDDMDTSIVNEKSLREKCIVKCQLQNDNAIAEIEKRIVELKKNLGKFLMESKIIDNNDILKNGIKGFRDMLFCDKDHLNAYEMNIDTINLWLQLLKY